MPIKTVTYKIDGWTASDVLPSIHDRLKEFAQEVFDWKEEIPDPQNPEQIIPNPQTYEEAIFVDKPMKDFWIWYQNKLDAAAKSDNSELLTNLKAQTKVIRVEE